MTLYLTYISFNIRELSPYTLKEYSKVKFVFIFIQNHSIIHYFSRSNDVKEILKKIHWLSLFKEVVVSNSVLRFSELRRTEVLLIYFYYLGDWKVVDGLPVLSNGNRAHYLDDDKLRL